MRCCPIAIPAVKPWKSLSPDEQKLYARFMEVYAGFLEYTDHEIGRVVQHVKDIGEYDNTLFVVIIGDNGASKEGTAYGDVDRSLIAKPLSEQENIAYNLEQDRPARHAERDRGQLSLRLGAGGEHAVPQLEVRRQPRRRQPQPDDRLLAEGHQRNAGEVRTQYGHVIDILPTTLELAGLKAPERIRSVPQQPIEGISLAYSIADAGRGIAPHDAVLLHLRIAGDLPRRVEGLAGLSQPLRLRQPGRGQAVR